MLYLIRGLPGSGKSTLARKLSVALNAPHFEADDFFTMWDGMYLFDAKRLPEAHAYCFDKVRICTDPDNPTMNGDTDQPVDVIVANTFSRIWEMQKYLDLAKERGIPVTVITCEGNYGSTHDVPDHAIERMKERWEAYP